MIGQVVVAHALRNDSGVPRKKSVQLTMKMKLHDPSTMQQVTRMFWQLIVPQVDPVVPAQNPPAVLQAASVDIEHEASRRQQGCIGCGQDRLAQVAPEVSGVPKIVAQMARVVVVQVPSLRQQRKTGSQVVVAHVPPGVQDPLHALRVVTEHAPPAQHAPVQEDAEQVKPDPGKSPGRLQLPMATFAQIGPRQHGTVVG